MTRLSNSSAHPASNEGKITSPRPSASLTLPLRLTVSSPGFQNDKKVAAAEGAGVEVATMVSLLIAVVDVAEKLHWQLLLVRHC